MGGWLWQWPSIRCALDVGPSPGCCHIWRSSQLPTMRRRFMAITLQGHLSTCSLSSYNASANAIDNQNCSP